jgi:6,7-dimethyl-8-ribityllumazine synthase
VTSATHGDGTLVAPAGSSLVADAELPADARVAIVASRYHSEVIQQLLNGALEAVRDAGVDVGNVDVIPAAGAFELGLLAREAAQSGRYVAIAALGCVIRGGTPHFEYVCAAATDGLNRVALDTGTPIGFGLLTCDTEQQALDRAGLPGSREDKGREAVEAAVATALVLKKIGAQR